MRLVMPGTNCINRTKKLANAPRCWCRRQAVTVLAILTGQRHGDRALGLTRTRDFLVPRGRKAQFASMSASA